MDRIETLGSSFVRPPVDALTLVKMITRRVALLAVMSVAACQDEPALPGGPCVGECWVEDPSTPLDAGSLRPDGGTYVLLDSDGGLRDGGASNGRDAAVTHDAGFVDAGEPRDAGPAPRDAGAPPRDAGPTPRDGGTPVDAGNPGVALPGTYVFTRKIVSPIAPNQELTHVAIAPDGASMIVSERYDRLHVIALPGETHVRTVHLPKSGSELLGITGIRYVSGGAQILVIATAYEGSAISGRVFRLGALGESPSAVGPAFPNVAYESIDGHPTVAGRVMIVGRTNGFVRIYSMDPNANAPALEGQAAVTAGCQDAAPVVDAFGNMGAVYACGMTGGAVGEFDGVSFYAGPAVGNTSHVASRPQRDYALFVNWSIGKLARYDQGAFTVGAAAPDLGSLDLWDITFADDGRRALITGEMIGSVAQMREYRDGAYSTSGITDISIANFDASPYGGTNGVVLLEAAWRPGTDCGYVVGGCSTANCTRGYLIAFEVVNGRACP